MNKEMNKLLLKTTKYDLGSGLLISLIIILISTFINAGIYMVGICVALINFLASGYVIEKFLRENKKMWIIIPTYLLRMAFIAITIVPFAKNIQSMIYYMAGFISHYALLIVFGIINRKGSV